ncbi:MAG TPA: NAD(P)H-binding protein [Steroidobacteraceae bacterium]|nr:NAD(P)H-binding protein [Steroidobacteraceae bacterium]
MRVLVAGGTGMLGAPVVRHLSGSGHRVRVLTRRPEVGRRLFGPEVEIAAGDVTQPATLAAAVAGCDALHVSLRGGNDWRDYERVEHHGLATLLERALEAGVRKVTYLSGAGEIGGHEQLPPVAIKLAAEAALRECGMAFTIFRATHFMESLQLFIRGGRATILGTQPHSYHYLAAHDFAALVSRALQTPASDGKTLTAFGPESFTMEEALTRYLAVLHPGAKLSHLPLAVARLLGTLTANRDLRFAATLFASFAAIGEAGDPQESDRLLGKPSTRLSEWLQTRLHEERAA